MLSIVISVLALVISIATPVIEYFLNKKLNKNDAVANYLRDVLSTPVFIELPTAIQDIHLNGKEVEGIDSSVSVLRTIRKKSLFYQHIDKKFYEEYKAMLQELENLLITTACVENDADYVDFFNKVTDYVNRIYKTTAEHLF